MVIHLRQITKPHIAENFHSRVRQCIYLHYTHSNHSYFIDAQHTMMLTSPNFIPKNFRLNACRILANMFQSVTLSFHVSNIQFICELHMVYVCEFKHTTNHTTQSFYQRHPLQAMSYVHSYIMYEYRWLAI